MTGSSAGYNARHAYAYRADGLRTSKTWYTGSSQMNWTRYRYDGQMGVEDIEGTTINGVSTISAVTRTGLGARSVEVISKTTSTGNTLTYPLYDIHGNMVAALSKTGSTFSVGEARTYDAWGQVRSQVGSDGKLRYCGNLGHKQDDESGLIYMRARYYEPSSGRFVSEDPARYGMNWYGYAGNIPTRFVDNSGKNQLEINDGDGNWFSTMLFLSAVSIFAACSAVEKANVPAFVAFANAALFLAGLATGCFTNLNGPIEMLLAADGMASVTLQVIALNTTVMKKLPAGAIIGTAVAVYTLVLLAALIDLSFESVDFNMGAR